MRAILAIAVVALSLTVAACGEKDEPLPAPAAGTGQVGGGGGGGTQSGGGGGATDEQQIAKAIEAVVGGNDPQKTCETYATIVYVKHSYGDAKGCRAAVADQKTFAVSVSGTEIKGKSATSKAKPQGGPNQGETLKVDLVQEGGAWKVDVVRSNAKVGP